MTIMVSVCAAVARSETMDLGEVFGKADSWSLDAEAFLGDYQRFGFRFLDGKGSAMSSDKEKLRFLGQPVFEARAYFAASSLSRIEISVYNKGDAGAKDREAFDALADKTKSDISGHLRDSGMTGKTTSERANYVVRRHQWVKRTPGVQLEWAYVEPHRSGGRNVEYGAEYIKVVMVPIKKGGSRMTAITGGMRATRAKSGRTVKENVKREANGDVWIENVPMVDQGQKGYCAAASSERVLRYYGLTIDQHQIAQLAETAAAGGTTLEGMAAAVGKVGRQFQLDKRDLISIDSGGSFERSEHAKQLDRYNAAAKKKKAAVIDWQEFTSNHMVDMQAIWRAMDPAILLDAKSAERQGMKQFVRNIKTYAEQGVPLLWSCLVGMYPEEPELGQPGVYGHVRLIIGYNEKSNELLYSDSWGPRHALKRLPLDQAWAMTKGLIVLKPRDVR
ncbi:MAG: hypothetical protein PHG71_04150 [Kiritimatiellae bacterium]|nr:hypothetical protein [Kiritimatiellia bacterium]